MPDCLKTRVVSISVRGARGTSSEPSLVPVIGAPSFKPFSTPSRPAAMHRRHRQVGIDVGARAARLEPRRLRAAGEDAKARGPVVDAPGRLDRRPEAVDEALVAVDRRPEHRRELHQAGDLAGDVALEQRAHPARRVRVVEEVGLAVLAFLQALVDVAAAARVLRVPLGHEARHDPEARADLLGAGLEQDRTVGLLERLAERDRDLVDARPGLGVQALDRHAEGEHLVHQRVHELAVVVHAQQRVAEHARRDRLRVDAALRVPASAASRGS